MLNRSKHSESITQMSYLIQTLEQLLPEAKFCLTQIQCDIDDKNDQIRELNSLANPNDPDNLLIEDSRP